MAGQDAERAAGVDQSDATLPRPDQADRARGVPALRVAVWRTFRERATDGVRRGPARAPWSDGSHRLRTEAWTRISSFFGARRCVSVSSSRSNSSVRSQAARERSQPERAETPAFRARRLRSPASSCRRLERDPTVREGPAPSSLQLATHLPINAYASPRITPCERLKRPPTSNCA